MINLYSFYNLPNWQLGFLIVGTFFIAGSAGLILSRSWLYRRFRISSDTNESVNGFFAGVGVLYGILLGLMAVAGWENYETVDGLATKEAAAVAALYRDVSILPEPARGELQDSLKRYLSYVVEVAWPAHRRGEIPNGGTQILSEFAGTITNHYDQLADQDVLLAEALSAYNNLIEARRLRMAAVNMHIPAIFWLVILSGAILTTALTYFFHLPTLSTHLALTSIFSIFLGLMILLIASLDNHFQGEVSVNSTAYQTVLHNLKELEPIQIATKPGLATNMKEHKTP